MALRHAPHGLLCGYWQTSSVAIQTSIDLVGNIMLGVIHERQQDVK